MYKCMFLYGSEQFTRTSLSWAERSFLSNAPPGNRAQQSSAKKPKDTNNVSVNRVGNSKKQKQRKRRKQPTARERNAAEAAKMQVEGFVTFWHDGKWHRVAKWILKNALIITKKRRKTAGEVVYPLSQNLILNLVYYIDSLNGSVVPALSGKGQAYLSCARKPGFLFFSEKDRTTHHHHQTYKDIVRLSRNR